MNTFTTFQDMQDQLSKLPQTIEIVGRTVRGSRLTIGHAVLLGTPLCGELVSNEEIRVEYHLIEPDTSGTVTFLFDHITQLWTLSA